MKLLFLSLFAMLASLCAAATTPLKAVVVSYADNTPDSVISQAKDAIEAAGGRVTHDFKLIKAFAANAPSTILDSVQAWGNDYSAVIEEDGTVQASGNGK